MQCFDLVEAASGVGRVLGARGYLALLPDSFGPRGKAYGFGRGSHGDPDRDDVNERTVRPLDAEGALKYLQARQDVTRARIYLQGWSNGASTTLNVLYRQALANGSGFHGAIALYPGCGPRALMSQDFKTNAPVTVFLGRRRRGSVAAGVPPRAGCGGGPGHSR